jgi:hypothetical protein
MFRPNQFIPGVNGAEPCRGLLVHGVAGIRPQPGWLVLENADGAVVYAVPSDVVAYAADISFDTKMSVIAKTLGSLKDALKNVRPQGEA